MDGKAFCALCGTTEGELSGVRLPQNRAMVFCPECYEVVRGLVRLAPKLIENYLKKTKTVS